MRCFRVAWQAPCAEGPAWPALWRAQLNTFHSLSTSSPLLRSTGGGLCCAQQEEGEAVLGQAHRTTCVVLKYGACMHWPAGRMHWPAGRMPLRLSAGLGPRCPHNSYLHVHTKSGHAPPARSTWPEAACIGRLSSAASNVLLPKCPFGAPASATWRAYMHALSERMPRHVIPQPQLLPPPPSPPPPPSAKSLPWSCILRPVVYISLCTGTDTILKKWAGPKLRSRPLAYVPLVLPPPPG